MSIKKLISISGTVVTCALCLALFGGFQSSAAENTTSMAATTYVHVRDAAGMNGRILGTLSPDEAVTVTGVTDGWYHVQYGNGSGYVYQKYLNFEGSSAEGDVPNGRETDMKSTTSLNVRSGPGTGYKVVGYLKPEEKIQVIGKTDGWYKVKYNNADAYASAHYLTFLTPDSTPAPSSGNTGSSVQPDAGFNPKKVTVTARSLHVRSGASTSSQSIGGLTKGQVVEAIGKDGSWYKINYNGRAAYINDQYVEDGEVDFNEQGATKTATTGVNMRTSASTKARVIRVIPQGAQVKVLERDGGWYYVEYDGDSGAVYGKYLK